MSELRPNSNPEFPESYSEAPSLTPNTRIDLHKSNLQSAKKGREFARAARAAIDAQLNLERPPQPIPQQEVAEVGMHLADIRAWEMELSEGEGEQARSFRKIAVRFEQKAREADDFMKWEAQMQQESQEADESVRREEEFPRGLSDTDINGYELTNSGR